MTTMTTVSMTKTMTTTRRTKRSRRPPVVTLSLICSAIFACGFVSNKTVKMLLRWRTFQINSHRNLKSIHRGPVPDNVWWRHKEDLTIWTIWIGGSDMPPLVQAAVDTCRMAHPGDRNAHRASSYAHEPFLHYRVVTDEDLADPEKRLGFSLHPSFDLLDPVEKSDYLRGELLHYHGGFYMDADVLCLTSFRDILQRSAHDAAGAQDLTNYGPYPSLSQNALGPFRQKSPITTWWHEELHQVMDALTPQLEECRDKYGGTIPYPTPRHWGTSICGVEWGGAIDFIRPVWRALAEDNRLGHDLTMCNVDGHHLGWGDSGDCHIVHLGTAGDFFKRHDWTLQDLCEKLKVLRNSRICSQTA